jgi:protein TonB
VKVVSGPPLLAQSAMDAVRKWRYTPYLLNGKPVKKETQINITFIPQ